MKINGPQEDDVSVRSDGETYLEYIQISAAFSLSKEIATETKKGEPHEGLRFFRLEKEVWSLLRWDALNLGFMVSLKQPQTKQNKNPEENSRPGGRWAGSPALRRRQPRAGRPTSRSSASLRDTEGSWYLAGAPRN